MFDRFSKWFTEDLMKYHGWVFSVFSVVLVTLIISAIETLIYKRLHKRLKLTTNIWDDSLLKAAHKPFRILIWIIGISIAAEIVARQASDPLLFSYIEPVRKLAIIALIGWFLVRLVKQVELNILTPRPGKKIPDKTVVAAVSQLLRISFVITISLIAAQSLGFSISGVLAFGGVGGLAIGFAAKDLLSNFFGGMMIYLDRPFKVGDWIRSPDKNIEGTVEQIGWRLTRIRTFDRRPLYVPNGIFSTIAVENPSRMHNRRIRTVIGLRYEDAAKVADVTKAITEMLKNHPEIDTKQTLMVHLIEFGASSLDILIYTFTKTIVWTDFQAIQEDVFLKIIDIIHAHGADCAFPARTLYVPDGIQMNPSQPSSENA